MVAVRMEKPLLVLQQQNKQGSGHRLRLVERICVGGKMHTDNSGQKRWLPAMCIHSGL